MAGAYGPSVRTHRTGLLIIRAWVEGDSAEPLRAHLRMTDDISQGIERTVTVARVADVGDLIDEWLQGVVDAGDEE